jgi:DNA uptake protein ComE-like DNA-binding protein
MPPAVHRKDQLIRGKNVPTNEKWPIDPKKQKKHHRVILKKLNSHDGKTLMSLQGIGPKTACMIIPCSFVQGVAFRFESIQDLRKVRGLGKAFFKKFKKFVYP